MDAAAGEGLVAGLDAAGRRDRGQGDAPHEVVVDLAEALAPPRVEERQEQRPLPVRPVGGPRRVDERQVAGAEALARGGVHREARRVEGHLPQREAAVAVCGESAALAARLAQVRLEQGAQAGVAVVDGLAPPGEAREAPAGPALPAAAEAEAAEARRLDDLEPVDHRITGAAPT